MLSLGCLGPAHSSCSGGRSRPSSSRVPQLTRTNSADFFRCEGKEGAAESDHKVVRTIANPARTVQLLKLAGTLLTEGAWWLRTLQLEVVTLLGSCHRPAHKSRRRSVAQKAWYLTSPPRGVHQARSDIILYVSRAAPTSARLGRGLMASPWRMEALPSASVSKLATGTKGNCLWGCAPAPNLPERGIEAG